ncbi:hypothetical protein [Rhizobium binae]|uniref:hypothetical protein n=1 Tax=Rhizobium binae TaxID=1138190 RepID=UPI003DA98D15
MKTLLFAIGLACALPAVVEASDSIHVTVVQNDKEILVGFLHVDATGRKGNIESFRDHPYMICRQESPERVSADSATATDGASVQITRRDNGLVDVEVTVKTVDQHELKLAQNQCAATTVEVKSVSDKILLQPSDGPVHFHLAGATVAIKGL